eukprot:3978395-Pyramimonas_sp.AAC.1
MCHCTTSRATQHRIVIRAAIRLIYHPLLKGVPQLEPCSWGRGVLGRRLTRNRTRGLARGFPRTRRNLRHTARRTWLTTPRVRTRKGEARDRIQEDVAEPFQPLMI